MRERKKRYEGVRGRDGKMGERGGEERRSGASCLIDAAL